MSKASLLMLLVTFVLGFPDSTKSPAKKLEGQRPQPAASYRFAPPVRVKAAGKPIDTDVGHAAPLVVDFDRPLDHGLLQHSLTVRLPHGGQVGGSIGTGPEERSWAFFPAEPWAPGDYHLVIDHRLEDLAGNSASRVFDRDLSGRQDDPRPSRPIVLPLVASVRDARW